MGNSSNKKKSLEKNMKIGKEIRCPLCNKIFNKNSSYATVLNN
jgi:hypothetical protein